MDFHLSGVWGSVWLKSLAFGSDLSHTQGKCNVIGITATGQENTNTQTP